MLEEFKTDEMIDNLYLYIVIGAVIVILIVALTSKKFKASFSKIGIKVDADKNTPKDSVKVKKVKNKAEIDVTTKKNQEIEIDDVDDSKVNIK